jgi:hypothetical protein
LDAGGAIGGTTCGYTLKEATSIDTIQGAIDCTAVWCPKCWRELPLSIQKQFPRQE